MQSILTDNLQSRRISSKLVPRLVSDEQKENLISVCTELKSRLDSDPDLMSKIVTEEERRVYEYENSELPKENH